MTRPSRWSHAMWIDFIYVEYARLTVWLNTARDCNRQSVHLHATACMFDCSDAPMGIYFRDRVGDDGSGKPCGLWHSIGPHFHTPAILKFLVCFVSSSFHISCFQRNEIFAINIVIHDQVPSNIKHRPSHIIVTSCKHHRTSNTIIHQAPSNIKHAPSTIKHHQTRICNQTTFFVLIPQRPCIYPCLPASNKRVSL